MGKLRKTFIYIGLLIFVSQYLFSCGSSAKQRLTSKDSITVIETALNHVLSMRILSKDFYNQPLQIVVPEGVSTNLKIKVTGKNSILVPHGYKFVKSLRGMEIYKPIPLVEIIALKVKDGKICTELIFRATGQNLLLQHTNKDGSFRGVKVKERTIEVWEGTLLEMCPMLLT